MKTLKINNNESRIGFTNDLFELYLKNNFGSLNKTEFEELLLELLRRHSNLGNMSNFEISINLHLPESRVRSMVYRSQLKYVNYKIEDIRKQLFGQLWQGYFEIKDDMIRITIENQYVKQAVESIVKEKGGVPVGTFNKETLILSSDGFSKLLPSLFTDEEIKLISAEIRKKNAGSFETAIKSLIKPDSIKESIIEICGSLLEGVGKALVTSKFSSLLGS